MRRTKEDAERTRERILDAAETVFYDRGVARTTLEQVAHAAGVTRGAIYWHFDSKATLLEAVHQRVRQPLTDLLYRMIDDDPPDALARVEAQASDVILRLYQDDRTRRVMTIVLLKCEQTEEMAAILEHEQAQRQKFLTSLARFFARLQDRGLIAPGVPEVQASALHAFMLGLFSDVLRFPAHFPTPDHALAQVRYFFTIFAPRRGEAPPGGVATSGVLP
ncbi:TetR family transcriptional regulator [Rhodospirillum centenum]|uniref:HTH-type transcriptional regulator TtgR n=1 Tax=Rhodospirillum centenum (strain ATCC 51521 / SW) TaxID=414684 RepID=B6IQL8_RHOCS|nr:TetR family transcriptional regulator [Rhodospirillum centenum]ACI97754.1 HTH-type transcriptional regulator TtgR [Rhodospirillum centenum SW]